MRNPDRYRSLGGFAHANQLRADRALHALLGMKRFPSDDTILKQHGEARNDFSHDLPKTNRYRLVSDFRLCVASSRAFGMSWILLST
jgi:hypothetical protein